jgi:hypothetical protein
MNSPSRHPMLAYLFSIAMLLAIHDARCSRHAEPQEDQVLVVTGNSVALTEINIVEEQTKFPRLALASKRHPESILEVIPGDVIAQYIAPHLCPYTAYALERTSIRLYLAMGRINAVNPGRSWPHVKARINHYIPGQTRFFPILGIPFPQLEENQKAFIEASSSKSLREQLAWRGIFVMSHSMQSQSVAALIARVLELEPDERMNVCRSALNLVSFVNADRAKTMTLTHICRKIALQAILPEGAKIDFPLVAALVHLGDRLRPTAEAARPLFYINHQSLFPVFNPLWSQTYAHHFHAVAVLGDQSDEICQAALEFFTREHLPTCLSSESRTEDFMAILDAVFKLGEKRSGYSRVLRDQFRMNPQTIVPLLQLLDEMGEDYPSMCAIAKDLLSTDPWKRDDEYLKHVTDVLRGVKALSAEAKAVSHAVDITRELETMFPWHGGFGNLFLQVAQMRENASVCLHMCKDYLTRLKPAPRAGTNLFTTLGFLGANREAICLAADAYITPDMDADEAGQVLQGVALLKANPDTITQAYAVAQNVATKEDSVGYAFHQIIPFGPPNVPISAEVKKLIPENPIFFEGTRLYESALKLPGGLPELASTVQLTQRLMSKVDEYTRFSQLFLLLVELGEERESICNAAAYLFKLGCYLSDLSDFLHALKEVNQEHREAAGKAVKLMCKRERVSKSMILDLLREHARARQAGE